MVACATREYLSWLFFKDVVNGYDSTRIKCHSFIIYDLRFGWNEQERGEKLSLPRELCKLKGFTSWALNHFSKLPRNPASHLVLSVDVNTAHTEYEKPTCIWEVLTECGGKHRFVHSELLLTLVNGNKKRLAPAPYLFLSPYTVVNISRVRISFEETAWEKAAVKSQTTLEIIRKLKITTANIIMPQYRSTV